MGRKKEIITGISIIISSILLARLLIFLGETDTTVSALGIIIGACCIFTKRNNYNLPENTDK